MFELGTLAPIVLSVIIVPIAQDIKIVPQQHAWILERLGKYHATLSPGPNIVLPFVDRVAYKHMLREVPLDVPSQICITKDNTWLRVDDILYFQMTDPMRASYGSSDFVIAITQPVRTMLRPIVDKLELDKTSKEHDFINYGVVNALDEAAPSWSVEVLRYEVKDLAPPKEILYAMQTQTTVERERRALITASEGKCQEQIDLVSGARETAIQRSEGEKQAAINRAQGETAAVLTVAETNVQAVQKIGQAIRTEGGIDAVDLKMAEEYTSVFDSLAKQDNMLIVPGNIGDLSTMIVSALTIARQQQRPGA